MSQEDLEIVRRAVASFGSRFDARAIPRHFHPEISYRAIEGALDDTGEFTGYDAMRAYYREWIDTFAEIRTEPDEFIDCGKVIVGVLRIRARMKESDAEIDLKLSIVYEVRDGLLYRIREYATKEEALAAAAAW